MSPSRPIKVAVVGGGCAALTAAFELTDPKHQGRFEVTVYQLGWRLGGKGASGRGPDGRIEEHGLHIWMGFYENAFRVMRRAYGELARAPGQPMARWDDAFKPSSHIGLANWSPDEDWTVWSSVFPELPGRPGDPLPSSADNPFTVAGYLARMAGVMLRLFETAYGPPAADDGGEDLHAWDGERLLGSAAHLGRAAVGATDTLVGLAYNRVRVLAELVRRWPGAAPTHALLQVVLASMDALRPARSNDPHRQRAAEVLELTVAAAFGILRDGLLTNPRGLDAIDHLDFCDWLRRSGASEHAVHSPFMRGLYCLMFAYEGGDYTRPRTAAGQALRGCLRMFFTYRGAFFWKMQAGMGDIVFAPLFEVLARRGVRFEFFHRLTNVGLEPTAPDLPRRVATLAFDVQARVHGGEAYQPLVDVRGLPSWPSVPNWAQLEQGDALCHEQRNFESFWDPRKVATKTLVAGRDFDLVALGVSVGAIPTVCSELLAVDARWRDMVANLATVATQALQLWSSAPMTDLGWHRGPITMTAFTSPFDTWSDMTHLVPVEDWPEDRTPQSIAYFCNVLDERDVLAAGPRDSGYQGRIHDVVGAHAEHFVARELPRIWPSLAQGGGLRSDVLQAQFVVGNVNPSDRYVQCLPDTPRFRISPLDRSYENMTIAGDWTECGLSVGCVESAVMSGLLAAHALSQAPTLASIIGYDHP